MQRYLILVDNDVRETNFSTWIKNPPNNLIKTTEFKDQIYKTVLLGRKYDNYYFCTYLINKTERKIIAFHQNIKQINIFHNVLMLLIEYIYSE